jgi:hypothetical protein
VHFQFEGFTNEKLQNNETLSALIKSSSNTRKVIDAQFIAKIRELVVSHQYETKT